VQVFRRVVLPILYLVVLLVIAVSLAWLAFAPSGEAGADDEFPTGELLGTETVVERGSIEASLEADGTIAIADPVAAKPGHDGTVNHIWVRPGMVVEEGDDLFQIMAEELPDEAPDAGAPDGSQDAEDAEPAPAPEPRRTYHTVTAPADGTVGSFDLHVGDDLAKGTEALTVTPRTYSATADIEPVELYRLGDLPDTAQIIIDQGPAPFDCTSLSLLEAGAPPTGGGGAAGGGDTGGDAAGDADMTGDDGLGMGDDGMDAGAAGDTGSGTTQLRCGIPDDVEVYNGLTMRMIVDVGSADDVLTVPVTAVRGMGEDASVWVPGETGEPEERSVTIGMSDGTRAEVVSGLEEGESILEYVPGTEPDMDEGMDFGMVG
jgi:multidrug efflux pump subunit AcrA (membrane-fusion protein)